MIIRASRGEFLKRKKKNNCKVHRNPSSNCDDGLEPIRNRVGFRKFYSTLGLLAQSVNLKPTAYL